MLIVGLLVAACGGLSLKTPRCRRNHDQCSNRCALRCEASANREQERQPEGIGMLATTWSDPGCQNCVSHCDELARACEEKAERAALDE